MGIPHQTIIQCQRGVLQFNSVLMLSAWRQHQAPGLRNQPHKTALHSDTSCKTWLSPVLLASQLQIGGHLLEWLTELRKVVYFLDYWFTGSAQKVSSPVI